MTKRIAIIPGDGIGMEVTAEAQKVLETLVRAQNLPLELVLFDWSAGKYLREGISLPGGALEMLRRDFDAIFVGAFGDPRIPSNQHAVDILLGIRFGLDLYVNQRPVRLLADKLCPLKNRTARDVRFVIFRENAEGPYVGIGGNFRRDTPDEVAVQEDVSTRKGVERILVYAFEYARQRGLKQLCMSDKSKLEPVHGSAPSLAGKNLANPMAAILTAGMMLDYLGYGEVADTIERVVARAIDEDKTTPDLGGRLGTREVGD